MHIRDAQLAFVVCAFTTSSVRGEEGECSSRGLYEGEFFPGVGKIQYKGPDSTDPLSFHYYNADEVIMGKPMKEWWVACLLASPSCFMYLTCASKDFLQRETCQSESERH